MMTGRKVANSTRYSRGMKRVLSAMVLVASSFVWSAPMAVAEEDANPVVESTPTTEAPATTTAPATETNPCLEPGYACGWAVLGPDGAVTSVIVCTFEVCGSGSFGGMNLALQARQTADGNVAGWHGPEVRYDSESKVFTLPGGGSIQAGDHLENAVFPTTSGNVAGPGNDDGQTIEEYYETETDIVIAADAVSYKVPIIEGARVDYVVVFDPVGSAAPSVVQEGSIGGDVTSQSANKRTHSRVSVRMASLGAKRGVLTLELAYLKQPIASISTTVTGVKKYASCAQLRADYPNGVRASRAATDKAKGKAARVSSVPAVVGPGLYRVNARLDRDRDLVACERG